MIRFDAEIVGRSGAAPVRIAAEDWMAISADAWADGVAVDWIPIYPSLSVAYEGTRCVPDDGRRSERTAAGTLRGRGLSGVTVYSIDLVHLFVRPGEVAELRAFLAANRGGWFDAVYPFDFSGEPYLYHCKLAAEPEIEPAGPAYQHARVSLMGYRA